MLDLADLALGSRPPAKKKYDGPVVEKEQVFSAATAAYADTTPQDPPLVVEKTRTRT